MSWMAQGYQSCDWSDTERCIAILIGLSRCTCTSNAFFDEPAYNY